MTDAESSQKTDQEAAVAIAVWLLGGVVLAAVGTWGIIEIITNFEKYGLLRAVPLSGISAMSFVFGMRMVIDVAGDERGGGIA